MTAETNPEHPPADLSVIIPPEVRLTVDGIPIKVKRLRSREVLALARVISSGLGDIPLAMALDWNDRDDIKGKLVGMLLVAIPLAAEEAFDFYRGVVTSVEAGRADELADAMTNPDIGDLLDITEAMFDQEGPALLDLVGKAQRLAGKVGTLFQDRKPPAGADGSIGRSPGPSTSSPRSTDGPTTRP